MAPVHYSKTGVGSGSTPGVHDVDVPRVLVTKDVLVMGDVRSPVSDVLVRPLPPPSTPVRGAVGTHVTSVPVEGVHGGRKRPRGGPGFPSSTLPVLSDGVEPSPRKVLPPCRGSLWVRTPWSATSTHPELPAPWDPPSLGSRLCLGDPPQRCRRPEPEGRVASVKSPDCSGLLSTCPVSVSSRPGTHRSVYT